jgi:Zn-dependent protease with chaperone function
VIVGGSLLIGAMLVGWLAPVPLSRLVLRGGPAASLTWWFVLTVAAFSSAAAAGVLLMLGDHLQVDSDLWHICWALLGHRHVHPTDEVTGVLVLTVVCMATVKAARTMRRRLHAQRRAHRAHMDALATTALSYLDGVLWLEHDTPFAYSISGRPGLVVASTGLNRLPADQRDAVLCHEQHHLRRRHHWLVIAASAVTDALPPVPLFRGVAWATRTLTELAADHKAARDCGPDAVTSALLALGQPERISALKGLQAPTLHRIGAHLLAIAAGAVLPAMLGAILLTTMAVFGC